MGDIGLKRAKYFMRLLGNPQNKLKVIHIAGTSGKGSTAYLTSHILQSQGFKVGLSISPHVFDIRERMQVFRSTIISRTATANGGHSNKPTILNEKTIVRYFNQILPVILKMEKSKYGSPTFFEINVGLAYYIFYKEKVDYAVIETGLGGTLDGTNTVSNKNKVCTITKLGLDHTEILGKTITEIAGQKAGIIQKQNSVINIQQSIKAQKIVEEKCKEKNARLFNIGNKNYSIISSTPNETIFDFHIKDLFLGKIKLGLIGKHQAENSSLALACLYLLSKRDKFEINENLLRSMLRNINIPGRMETRIINSQKFIFDGAHNPQKMETFIKNLSAIYSDKKFTFCVAFKKGKDWQKMLTKIIPMAEKIYLSEFSTSDQDNLHSSVGVQEVSQFLLQKNFHDFETIKHSHILQNVRMLSRDKKKPIIITGSLYFIGSIK